VGYGVTNMVTCVLFCFPSFQAWVIGNGLGVLGKRFIADTILLLHVRLAGVQSGGDWDPKTRRMGWLALPIILIFNNTSRGLANARRFQAPKPVSKAVFVFLNLQKCRCDLVQLTGLSDVPSFSKGGVSEKRRYGSE
jgi:hypothetical protein